jgi:hypothetical protein
MIPDDLTWLPDDELYNLERQRTIDGSELDRIDAELKRRRRSRTRSPLADIAPSEHDTPTLGDLERIAASLEDRIGDLDRRVRGLRWWIAVVPLLWGAVAIGGWIALRLFAPEVMGQLARLSP